MKYVILIHSNPQPWGHPTSDFLEAFQELPEEEKQRMDADFDALLNDLHARGELVSAEALGAPSNARLFRWDAAGKPVTTDGPYSESKEHFAGFFVIDVESQERAEEIAVRFRGPGETVELRPTMWPSGEES